MKTLFASFNYIPEISLTRKDAEQCSHSGDCLPDVKEVIKKPYVQKQLKALDPEKLKTELKQYGAWSDEELQDMNKNYERIIWSAANDITEELYSK
jgi:hypothetical protein